MKQTNNKTLLDRVKDAPVANSQKKGLASYDIDTALSWLKGEVRLVQIGWALYPDRKTTNICSLSYLFLNRSLREAWRQGRIKIVE